MNATDLQERNPKKRSSRPALVVLGMHRSGTSAITGSLRFSGAWVGEEEELTRPNAENPQGFWERRDIRELCDQLLHAAGADWWKIAKFDTQAIPDAILAEQRTKFKKIVAALDEYDTWIVKEPRLCLLLPVLQDHIHNPICIHIYRNPLEVARSLQQRDGFSISAGLALWEAYNLHALNASRNLPRILICHQSLVSKPQETLNALVEKLSGFEFDHPLNPDTERIERFIDPKLYHQKATDVETESHLLPSQLALWSRLRSGNAPDHRDSSISAATRQQLLDFEYIKLSLSLQEDKSEKLDLDLRARDKTVNALNAGMESRAKRIHELNARLERRARTIQANDRKIDELNAGMESRAKRIHELNARLERRARTIQANDRKIDELNAGMESRAKRIHELNARLERRARTIQANDRKIDELNAGMESRAKRIHELNARLERRARTIQANDRKIDELNARLERRARTIQANDRKIDELNAGMESRAKRIHKLNAGMKSRAASIGERDKTISDLLNSTSWRVTRPLREISLGARSFALNLRRLTGRLSGGGSGRTARTIEPARGSARTAGRSSEPAPDEPISGQQPTDADRLAKRITEYTQAWQTRRGYGTPRKKRPGAKSKTKITVIAWDLGHNPLGRTYLLADVLRNDYDVELLGANFPRFGSKVWRPLRDCCRVTLKSFPGANFPEHFNHMEEIARQIEGDVIYVSKPRLPSLELAILAKLHRNRPIILDVDDHELAFFKNRRPLALDEVKTLRQSLDFNCPHDEIWTRYSESLIPLFDQVTVSGDELRKKFGGLVLPHIRDECDFDPAAYPRDLLRAELGFTAEDKIVLFVGTPRMHKGLVRIYAALKKLNRPHYRLVIVGTPVDREARRFLSKCSPEEVTIVPDTPFRDLPGYLCIGDLICLMQAEGEAISLYQTPAKFTDGLSMGIPMLASNVPPLENLAQEGLVERVGRSPLERKIDEIFRNYDAYKRKAMQNREVFLREYSYSAHLPRLKGIIDRLLDNPSPVPEPFHALIACHREMFSGSARLPRVTAGIVVDRRPRPRAQCPERTHGRPTRRIGPARLQGPTNCWTSCFSGNRTTPAFTGGGRTCWSNTCPGTLAFTGFSISTPRSICSSPVRPHSSPARRADTATPGWCSTRPSGGNCVSRIRTRFDSTPSSTRGPDVLFPDS